MSYKKALNCIRCGACMNTCPIYRRSGGHSYEYVIPGPIGSTLATFRSPKKHKSLSFACTLCGSCTNVCPVKIDLDSQLYTHRQDLRDKNIISTQKKLGMKMGVLLMSNATVFSIVGKIARKIVPILPKSLIYNKMNIWGKQRDIPKMPEKSFKDLYKKGIKDD